MRKRILALIMALALTLTLAPAALAAENPFISSMRISVPEVPGLTASLVNVYSNYFKQESRVEADAGFTANIYYFLFGEPGVFAFNQDVFLIGGDMAGADGAAAVKAGAPITISRDTSSAYLLLAADGRLIEGEKEFDGLDFDELTSISIFLFVGIGLMGDGMELPDGFTDHYDGLVADSLGAVRAPISELAEKPQTASPTASAVLVNGEKVAFDAYNIGGNNYFKLRDLAYILIGTKKQFDVVWDENTNSAHLTSGKAYTPIGSEMIGKGEGSKTALSTTSRIFIDGIEVCLMAYNIGGNNYFKLRDIGRAFDFGADWDGDSSTVVIDTSKTYKDN